jgi:hypothetical protein
METSALSNRILFAESKSILRVTLRSRDAREHLGLKSNVVKTCKRASCNASSNGIPATSPLVFRVYLPISHGESTASNRADAKLRAGVSARLETLPQRSAFLYALQNALCMLYGALRGMLYRTQLFASEQLLGFRCPRCCTSR